MMEWVEYPAGAILSLFNNKISVHLWKDGEYWVSMIGTAVIVRGPVKKVVMKNTEDWLINNCKKVLENK